MPVSDAARPEPGRPAREILIGLDTGGTYTDAVALDAHRGVIASAKAPTTHWDLSVGVGAAMRALLAALPGGVAREHISLVSVSTTLATNAVVESRFSPTCTLLIGFDDKMVQRSGLERGTAGVVVRLRGGHEATGEESEPLDETAIAAAVAEHGSRVEAFAVAAMFSVRNPEHELRARERIRSVSAKPVTCSHELSSQLDAPKRALTAALNARLTPHIRHLLEALERVLQEEGIAAPLMIVKGDGSLMRADVALEYPVETVLSGPAASVVGAGVLTGMRDFVVADMGGTTTDVAVVIGGQPTVRAEGATIGGWRTMVEAIDARTVGLGGDSEVRLDRDGQLVVGPRRVIPLSLLACQVPPLLADLQRLAASERHPPFAVQFALRAPGAVADQLDRLERRLWQALEAAPRRLGEITQSAQGLEAMRRLVDRGLATLAGFTPSDAMHVLGHQHGWSAEAARLGASILATEERNSRARLERDTPEGVCERVYQHVIREAARVVLESVLAHDPGLGPVSGRWGPLGALIDQLVAGREFSRLVDARLRLAVPLVAIGAPVAAYYPEIARRLGAALLVPEHAAVCNAVGAAAGVVSETCDVLVNQPTFQVFRVHDPSGARDYAESQEAIEDAKRVSRELALKAARRAGATDPHVETSVTERRARSGDFDYLAEATVRSRATGRAATGRIVPSPDR
ncbi:MAG TPA: hydantoinase/oxoprolinase family protein [Steroidobacteraceae bacterium]|nr:hydantoinase/oxoprolinase family protein [Steroidobacteraceae bacterium]